MKVAIIVDGGVIQEVVADKEAEVVIIDRDIEGSEHELKKVEGLDAYVYAGLAEAEVNIERIERIFKEANRSHE